MTDEAMTPERLDEIEKTLRWNQDSQWQDHDKGVALRGAVPDLCRALRAAWAERDGLKYELGLALRQLTAKRRK